MWLVVEDGKLHLRGLVDGEGYVLLNVRCPVACGKCCEDWRGVAELMELESKNGRCPHLGWTGGCCLKREKRPLECRAYACELAQLQLTGMLGDLVAVGVVQAGRQKDAAAYLGIAIPANDAWRPRFRERDERLVRRLIRKRQAARDRLRVSMAGRARGASVVEPPGAHPLGWRDGWPYF